MLVLAAVPEISAARLQRAVGHRFQFLPVATWTGTLDAILSAPLDMAVLDPALEDTPRAQEIERICVLFPSLPLVLYTKLTPDVVPVLLQLGRVGVREVVVAGHDDHPQRLSDVLVNEGAHALSRQLIEEIGDLLVHCPGQLRWAIETIVREPAAFHTVQDLAERARMDRRTCARWFTKAHLPPPSVVLMVFRVAYAHRLLQDPGYTVENVATKLGYAKARSFAQNVKEVFGMTPGELRVSLTPDEAIQIVRERFFQRPAAQPARHLAIVS
ncbi:MAG: helix-turn-helix domain-containing protein [Gemmatimonadales bacterium]|nr:helix-turn-helix domain-containing protein [Gemmatimonadales bacterium]NIN10089.1 helix-turn-helix domain-containing protein [Gemmatimonadales bacterium]NIR02573.1 helix-turn-helix domain-containing protein [Gemmatimonadales bacterium]NIS66267.1 helix-turn-helix domain-containing protein [Gemmatimonadales bacterium]